MWSRCLPMSDWRRNYNEEIIPVNRLTPTVFTDPPEPATTIRTSTGKQRTFFAPTLGIGVWTSISLHYTRTQMTPHIPRVWSTVLHFRWLCSNIRADATLHHSQCLLVALPVDNVSDCLCLLACVVLRGFSFVVLNGYVARFLCFVASVNILDQSKTESSWIKTKKTGSVLHI